MKRIESSIRSKTRPDWDFRIDPVVFLHSIYMKRIKISSIRSTSNLKSISSRWTWVLRSDRLENVRAASCKHVKRIDDIGTRDYFLKTHACFTEKPEMADQRKSKKIHRKAVSLIVPPLVCSPWSHPLSSFSFYAHFSPCILLTIYPV